MGRRLRTVSVAAEVDVDLADIADDDIRAEYQERKLGGSVGLSIEDHQARLLADFIVAGQTDDALALLHKISGGAFNVALVKKLASRSLAA
jgi:hypothetical protein